VAHVSELYHSGNRELQERFDTRRMADRIHEVLVADSLSKNKEFIESRDMFFLATADENGRPNCCSGNLSGGCPDMLTEPNITSTQLNAGTREGYAPLEES
jgi:predicted pyridoxine 5'-phosphate oxidase superfamily flavin-nucleotide-binding protein